MANIATIRISPDRDAIVSEIEIAAPAERVFQALVDPEQVVMWWGQAGIYRCTEFQADVQPGGKWHSKGYRTRPGGAFDNSPALPAPGRLENRPASRRDA